MQTVCLPFGKLSPHQLYDLLRLRSEIFVVEQNCVFLDMDNKDQHCHHLLIYEGELLVAATRLVPPGVYYNEMSIGRVVTHSSVRRSGVGRILMSSSLDFLIKLYGEGPVRIGAQYYLKKFYESFGFQQCGEIYVEDGIDHILMLKT
jgi:ElaA protein